MVSDGVCSWGGGLGHSVIQGEKGSGESVGRYFTGFGFEDLGHGGIQEAEGFGRLDKKFGS